MHIFCNVDMHASNFSNYLKISNDFLQNSVIMSYGPQLPPHLMKSKRPTDSDEDSDSDEGQDGPKLPSQPCLGPRPPTNIGPQLPSTHTQKDKDERDQKCKTIPPRWCILAKEDDIVSKFRFFSEFFVELLFHVCPSKSNMAT